MNSNTRIKIRVPKSLYESVKNELKKEGAKHGEFGQHNAKGAMEGLKEDAINEDLVNSVMDAIQSVDAETLGMIATMLGIGGAGAAIGKKLSKQDNPSLDKTMGSRDSMHEKKKAEDSKVQALAEAIKKVMQEKKKKKAADAEKKKKEEEAEKKKKEAAMAKKKEAAKKK